jgi:phosphoribosylformylglycinamidine synthase
MGAHNPIAFIHDVGAGGLSNAFPELVKDGGCGGQFELRKVPNDEPGMSPLEIWCNESQERYVLAVNEADLARFSQICERERCPFSVVGDAIEDAHLSLTDEHFNNSPVDLPMNVLFGKPPRMHRSASPLTPPSSSFNVNDLRLADVVERVLRLPSVGSKSFLITIGDRTITGLVARDQMVGPWQVPVANAAVTAASFDGYEGEAMAMGERTPLAVLDAAASGRVAVAESITNLASTHIGDISKIRLSANWMAAAGHPGEDYNLYRTVETVGMELCPALGIAIPVGKDSMSMKTSWKKDNQKQEVVSPLSLIVTGFAPVKDIRNTVTPQLRTDKGDTDLILIDLGNGQNRLGGSALAQTYNHIGHQVPDVDDPEDLKAFFAVVQGLIADKKLLAYHDRSDGGVFTTLCEMAFAGHAGLDIKLDMLAAQTADVLAVLFNEELGAVIQVLAEDTEEVLLQFSAAGLADQISVIGKPNPSGQISFSLNDQSLLNQPRIYLQRIWSETSYKMQSLRDNHECAQEEFDQIKDERDPGINPKVQFKYASDVSAEIKRVNIDSRPRIAILREQGVNGQIEMAAAFDRCGFASIDVHMSDIISGRVNLEQFQALVACGGFSYGDVLGAGEGWAKSILFNARAREQFEAFFIRQNTLSLGVCNGCQMLSNLHELIPGSELWPHFVRNRSEQFEARVAMVEIPSSPSLFLEGMTGSQLPIAIAHGEGRAEFVNDQKMHILQEQNLVALRYVDNYGQVTTTYPANPNGSPMGISGVCSEDGRVTIMMPHPERVFRTSQLSWHPDEWQENSPWIQMFMNARKLF